MVDLPTPPLPDATAMIEAMPGTPRLPWLCEAGACGAGRAALARACGGGAAGRGGTGASMPPPFFSAVSATIAPVTPGMALTDTLGGGAQRLHLLGARGRHGDREEHLAVGDEDVRDQSEIERCCR